MKSKLVIKNARTVGSPPTANCALPICFAFGLCVVHAVWPSNVTAVREVHNTSSPDEQKGKRTIFELERDLVFGEDDSDDTNELFGDVYDIGVDSRYYIYVVDHGFGRVQAYDSSGTFLRTIGHAGEGPGEYRSPSAVALDADDNVYVAGQGKIVVFDMNGRYVGEFRDGLGGFVRKVRVDEEGIIYLSCIDIFDQTVIHKYSASSGSRLLSFCDSYAVGQRVDTRVETVLAGGVLDLERGVVYYSQLSPYEIRTFSRNGELTSIVYRNNDFMHPPNVEYREDGGMRFGAFAASVSIVALHRGGFINVAIVPGDNGEFQTIVDLFNGEGLLLATRQFETRLPIKCKDAVDRLYAVDMEAAPRVVRYRTVVK